MKSKVNIFALAMLAGCSAHDADPLTLPQGNMPMTEREYHQSQLMLLKEQKLPHDEYLRRRSEILMR